MGSYDIWVNPDTFAWLDERETRIFDRYAEMGNVKHLIRELGDERKIGLSPNTFYAWLNASPARLGRWEAVLTTRGYISAAEAEEIAENATQQDANAARLKFEAKMRAAEWQNRRRFGKNAQVSLEVSVAKDWLAAIQAIADDDQLPPEADYTLLPSGDDEHQPSDAGQGDSTTSEPEAKAHPERTGEHAER